MTRKATASEIAHVLRSEPSLILEKLGRSDVQLSIPVDGQGLRVLAEVRPETLGAGLPTTVNVVIDGEDVEILIETRGTWQHHVTQ